MKAFLTFRRFFFLVPLLLLPVALLALACGGGEEEATATATEEGELFVDPSAPVVDVSLNEFSLTPSVAKGEAGPVTFSADNEGKIPHELVIIKTDTAIDKLPVTNGKVDEDAAGETIGEIEEFQAGLTLAGTFDLAPGKYALICNIAGHYQSGMHAEFEVEG